MITIDFSIVASIVGILILMAVLNSMLYKPVRKILEERESKMQSIEADVEKYARRVDKLVEDFERKMEEARLAGKQEFEKLREEAREEERQLLEAAQKEAEEKRSELMSQLASQIEAAKKELMAQAEAFASEIAQKLLGRAV